MTLSWDQEIESDEETVDDLILPLIGPVLPNQYRIESVNYGELSIQWCTPVKSAAWPMRIHVGKCSLQDRTFYITAQELQAKGTEPDYLTGPLGEIAASIRPR